MGGKNSIGILGRILIILAGLGLGSIAAYVAFAKVIPARTKARASEEASRFGEKWWQARSCILGSFAAEEDALVASIKPEISAAPKDEELATCISLLDKLKRSAGPSTENPELERAWRELPRAIGSLATSLARRTAKKKTRRPKDTRAAMARDLRGFDSAVLAVLAAANINPSKWLARVKQDASTRRPGLVLGKALSGNLGHIDPASTRALTNGKQIALESVDNQSKRLSVIHPNQGAVVVSEIKASELLAAGELPWTVATEKAVAPNDGPKTTRLVAHIDGQAEELATGQDLQLLLAAGAAGAREALVAKGKDETRSYAVYRRQPPGNWKRFPWLQGKTKASVSDWLSQTVDIVTTDERVYSLYHYRLGSPNAEGKDALLPAPVRLDSADLVPKYSMLRTCSAVAEGSGLGKEHLWVFDGKRVYLVKDGRSQPIPGPTEKIALLLCAGENAWLFDRRPLLQCSHDACEPMAELPLPLWGELLARTEARAWERSYRRPGLRRWCTRQNAPT